MGSYKVCILTAGVGSRMGSLAQNINKSLLPVNFKPVISHIIEKFSKDIELVVALGHKKEGVKEYLSMMYPDRKITFVDVDKYIGPGTGPGYSLLQCKDYLQCPFIFIASDTMVLEDISEPTYNWFGIAPTKDPEKYCTVKIKNNLVYQIDTKIKTNNKFAFIGLAGIKDYDLFFEALEKNKELKSGEIQVSNGFNSLIERKLTPIGFTWFDTGNLEAYKDTNQNLSGGDKKFDFSKGDEFLYFVDNKVIKYFFDSEIVRKRYLRSKKLEGLCPKIQDVRNNFYYYTKQEGQVLYNVLDNQVVNDFLQWVKQNLWKKISLSDEQKKEFKTCCKKFYYDKTIQRIESFYKKTGIEDGYNFINGVQVPPLNEMFEKIDWEAIFDGVPVNFHGDLQFDNVLVTTDPGSNLRKFLLLDWRQDFGGSIDFGDLYYDLAKLYGGMNLSYQLIKEGDFNFDISGTSVYYNFSIKNDLIEAKEEYEAFLKRNNYDTNKINIITALIYLNMAPLHHDPFDVMLYFMGKNKLYKALKKQGIYK